MRSGRGVPANAVLATSVMVTAILFAVQFVDDALDFSLDLTAALALAPLALASAYALRIALRREGYDGVPRRTRRVEIGVAAVSTVYTLFLLWAAGYVFLLLSCVLLAPATLLYVRARRERGARTFTRSGPSSSASSSASRTSGSALTSSSTQASTSSIRFPATTIRPYLPRSIVPSG